MTRPFDNIYPAKDKLKLLSCLNQLTCKLPHFWREISKFPAKVL